MTLIEKLEAATEGSRELDAEVAALFPYKTRAYYQWRGMQPRGTKQDDATYLRAHAPKFTISLDAAMTLVPDGWAFQMLYEPTAFHEALVWPPANGSPISKAKTLPLALCIAALKAMEGGHD